MLGMSGTNCYKTNGNNILNCNYDHFLLIKHLKALLFVMELTFDTRAYLSALFHFLSLASHLARILIMQTIGQVVGKRLTTLIRHEVLITKRDDRSSVNVWKRFYVSFDD